MVWSPALSSGAQSCPLFERFAGAAGQGHRRRRGVRASNCDRLNPQPDADNSSPSTNLSACSLPSAVQVK